MMMPGVAERTAMTVLDLVESGNGGSAGGTPATVRALRLGRRLQEAEAAVQSAKDQVTIAACAMEIAQADKSRALQDAAALRQALLEAAITEGKLRAKFDRLEMMAGQNKTLRSEDVLRVLNG